MLPGALARPAHHEQVTRSGPVQNGRAAAGRPQPERAGRAEGDECDDGLGQVPGHPVAVPGDAVGPVAVEVHPDLGESDPVPVRKRRRHLPQVVRRWRTVVEHPTVGEPGFGDGPVVHVHGPPAPWRLRQQSREQLVRAVAPTGPVVHPRAVGEHAALHPSEGVVEPDRATVEQRRLPRDVGVGHAIDGTSRNEVSVGMDVVMWWRRGRGPGFRSGWRRGRSTSRG